MHESPKAPDGPQHGLTVVRDPEMHQRPESTRSGPNSSDSEVAALKEAIGFTQRALAQQIQENALLTTELHSLRATSSRENRDASRSIQNELTAVTSSAGWQLLLWYGRIAGRYRPLRVVHSNVVLPLARRLIRQPNTSNVTRIIPVPAFYGDNAPLGGGPTLRSGIFPCFEEPVATVVIPVYNHWNHTFACLAALAAARERTPYEVIVVDDASQHDAQSALAGFSGLRILRQEHNQGFIRSCNAGAALSRGQYVVFLNNDTIPLPGWLDALVETFTAVPDAGIVGAKLIYPDGKLQEAGGIVFSDGSGWNYGRFDDPTAPQYSFLRDVDYCSGAALAVSRALFAELGGFDEAYAPAYYEDTDLAMRVRSSGRRVLYQPAAQVIHLEGVSSGTDVSSGVKAYQSINRHTFADRWRRELATHPAPGSNPRWASAHRARARVLVVDSSTPEPDKDSGSLRISGILQLLREEGCAVTFLPVNLMWADNYSEALQQLGVEVLTSTHVAAAEQWLAAHGPDLDLIITSRHYVASKFLPLARRYARQAPFVFDTVDIHFLRELREAELHGSVEGRKQAAVTRANELEVARQSDVTLVVSEDEKRLLENEVPGIVVKVLSNIHSTIYDVPAFSDRFGIIFVGGFQHRPNVDAAVWLVEEVLPVAQQTIPQLKCHIVGSRAPEQVNDLGQRSGVVVHGYVPDLTPLIGLTRVAVAPLRFGAGVKGKINTSMSMGQPVVATPLAVEGMHLRHGRDVMVGTTADEIARLIVRVHNDEVLWESLSAAGRRNVERHFSFDAARHAVRDILGLAALL